MDVLIIITTISFVLPKIYCSSNEGIKIEGTQLQTHESKKLGQQDTWQNYEKNIPLSLMLSKREPHEHKNTRKNHNSKNLFQKLNQRTPRYKKISGNFNRVHDSISPKKTKYSSCCCCKRRLSKKKMKNVLNLLKEAIKTFDDPPPKPKPIAPPCDLGTCCMPCSQASGCCCPCSQMVRVKYHPPQFDFQAMKGNLMCGCGFGNPCGGCLMKTGN